LLEICCVELFYFKIKLNFDNLNTKSVSMYFIDLMNFIQIIMYIYILCKFELSFDKFIIKHYKNLHYVQLSQLKGTSKNGSRFWSIII
jgi:hypothetical protein